MDLSIKLINTLVILSIIHIIYSCNLKPQPKKDSLQQDSSIVIQDTSIILNDSIILLKKLDSIFFNNNSYVADTFCFPIGINGSSKNYKMSQPFWNSRFHLGEDWVSTVLPQNGFGDSVYSISNGYILDAYDEIGGWGNVIKIFHKLPSDTLKYVISIYAHLHEIFIKKGDFVKKKEKIGTIGDADGKLPPHLHFELRTDVNTVIGSGYGNLEFKDYYLAKFINPSEFIKQHLYK